MSTPVWLELTKADSINGEDQTTYVNFSQVVEMTPVPSRNVTVLAFSTGFLTEVKEDPEAILRSLEGGPR
jgi:hypothetical protein